MEALFYIGQEIVAIRNHSQNAFKKGEEFIVLDIQQQCCQICIRINHELDTYFLNKEGIQVCNNRHEVNTKGLWFCQTSFAPKQYLSDTTYEDAINLVTTKEPTINH